LYNPITTRPYYKRKKPKVMREQKKCLTLGRRRVRQKREKVVSEAVNNLN
jgi:hypothetical protein